MLTEICQEIRNWFDRDMPKYHGEFSIQDGELSIDGMDILSGQYFRIIGSRFNDGVHKYGEGGLVDEDFSGTVCAMAVPPAFISLADEIAAWKEKYGSIDGQAMSPYMSESFGGYSYSKAGASSGGSGSGNGANWQSAFATRLNMWRKIL